MIYDDADEDKLKTDGSRQAAGMSIDDKMTMWGARSREEPREPESSDCFVGVSEDEIDQHEAVTQPELSLYKQTILDSPAYQWLVDSLFRESSFHWDDTQPRILVEVRQKIVDELPTGVISRKREPNNHKVTFQLSWRALQDRLQYERSIRNVGPRDALFTSIVFTGSSDHEIQATTVEQYLVQTWGTGGTQLLLVLHGLMEDGPQTPSDSRK